MDTAALPPLPLAEGRTTCDTLHMWTRFHQGSCGCLLKVCGPLRNTGGRCHSYVARGELQTRRSRPIAILCSDCELDFVDHHLLTARSNGRTATGGVWSRASVASFYQEDDGTVRECRASRRDLAGAVRGRETHLVSTKTASTRRTTALTVERFLAVLRFSVAC